MKKNLFFASSGGANTPPAKKPWSSLQNIRRTMIMLFVMLLSVGAWAATETQPSTVPAKDNNIVGTSYTIAATFNAGPGGKQIGAMTSKGVKFRTNRASVVNTDLSNAIDFNVNSGYAITGITLVGVTNTDNSAATIGSIYVDDVLYTSSFNGNVPAKNATEASNVVVSGINATSSIIFVFSELNSTSQANIEYTITYEEVKNCNDPATPLSITSDAPETLYAGTTVNLTISEGNGATPVFLLDGEAFEGTTWTAVAGTHTFSVSQAEYEGYCAQDAELELTVLAADAVESVTIEGPTAAYVGEAATFTATAANASDYAWTVNGVDANTNAAEFIFTPTAAGEYSIVCSARNQFNAANEWIASDAKVLTASNLSGELIKAVHTGKTAATVTGLIGGTADKSTESTGKINSNGYFGIQLASGNFQEGDTLVVNIGNVNSSGGAVLIIYAEKEAENVILNTGVAGVSGDNKFVLPAAINNKNALYIVRTSENAWNAVVNSISVIRPKPVKSTSEAFKSVSFNGEALEANFDENHAMTVEGSYVDAPVVVFTKTVTTIYEDNSQVVKDVEVNVTAEEVNDVWQAQAEINSVTYTINAAKATSFTVHYMDGTTELGTENVAVAGSPAEYAQYQSKNLATFVGWYNNADLAEEHIVADISAEVISGDITYYAKFENKYAESINMEQLVLDNGTAYDLMSFMGGKGFASNIDNSLDTLNDLENKANRNYAFLGLKVKAEGKLLNFRLAANSTVKVKFGNVGATPLVSINGGEYAAMELAEGVYTYTATDEALISIKTASNATLIFKQIMIDADLAEVVLPAPSAYAITLTPGENGQLAASWEGKTDKKVNVPVGATVALTVTPAEGYQVEAVTVNGEAIEAVENAYSFTMPNAVANVAATFVSAAPTPVDPVDPEITFNAGNYIVGAAALNLSTLFNSNSAGEVTYSIVDAGVTGATLDGANFTATAAGTATVRASQSAAAGFNAKTADAVITVAAAPAEPEGTKLIVGGEINSAYYTTLASITDDASYTVESIEYTKQLVFNSNMNTFSGQTLAGRGNRLVAYDTKTNSTDIILRVYNKDASNARKLYYQIVQEGETAGEVQNVSVAKASGQEIVIPTIANSKNTRILFAVENVNLLICQIYAQENGTTLPIAGQAGYALAIPGRLGTNGATSIDGLSIKANSDIKFISGTTYAELRGTDGGQFIKFATTGAVRVQITTNNTSKFYVCNSATGGNPDSDTQYGGTKSTFNIDLAAAGTWYVLPVTGSTGSSTGAVQITKIAFAEPPVAYSVTYDVNGATGDAPVQDDLYEGDKFNVASAAGLEMAGYDFDGWLCSVDAAKYAAGDEYTMTAADVTFTAQWVEHVQSSDATLSALEVAGLTLSPAFDPATEAYTATLPFYASMPVVADVTATKNSEYAAAPVITIAGNVISVSVKAENNDVKTYTITVNQEAAPAASSSINIEQIVLNEGKGADIAAALTAANIGYVDIDALDSINDDKENRNLAYFGLKVKKNTSAITVVVPAEKTLKIKFGNMACAMSVTINGVAQSDIAAANDHIYELDADAALREVVFMPKENKKTVVFKQIMIGEDIADFTAPYGIAIADGIENGAIAAAKWALPGDDVAVTVTPADGYVLENLIVNEVEKGAVSSFVMPSENVTISATFVASAPTPVDPVYTVVRDGLTPGYFYTMCLETNVTASRGASFWKPADYNGSSVELEEVVGELEAGIPYFFKATATTLEVVYGNENAAFAGQNNGLVGSFSEENITADAGNYILYDNKLYEVAAGQSAKVGAHRAYLNIGQINYVAPAPGMRRMAMPIQRGTATGIDAIEVGAELKKVVIDGQLYIVRDGRMYDVTGQLVR